MDFNGTYYYCLRNGQGDIVKLIDGNRNTVVEYTYDSWGKPLSCTGTLATTLGVLNPFRYRGYVYDEETQWYYLKSRYYDPETCRFISADVLLSTGQGVLGHNCYAYCLNNPIGLVDDDGIDPGSAFLSLFDLRLIHNMVADRVTFQQGFTAAREVFVTGILDGERVYGFLDVYNFASNTYYEIKSYRIAYSNKTVKQMRKYDSSTSPLPWKDKIQRGMDYMEGSFYYGAWLITYYTDPYVAGLVVYEYKFIPERAKKTIEITAGALLVGAVGLYMQSSEMSSQLVTPIRFFARA